MDNSPNVDILDPTIPLNGSSVGNVHDVHGEHESLTPLWLQRRREMDTLGLLVQEPVPDEPCRVAPEFDDTDRSGRPDEWVARAIDACERSHSAPCRLRGHCALGRRPRQHIDIEEASPPDPHHPTWSPMLKIPRCDMALVPTVDGATSTGVELFPMGAPTPPYDGFKGCGCSQCCK